MSAGGSSSSSSVSVTVRRAVVADAAAVSAAASATFLEAFGDHPANRRSDVEAYVAVANAVEKWERDLAHPGHATALALDAGGEIAGFASTWRGTRAPGVVGASPLELRRLYVVAGCRDRGVGSTLMAWTLDEAVRVGSDVVWLGVWDENPDAERFYVRWGFARVGETSFRLGPELQRDWVMSRPITPSDATTSPEG